MKKLVGLLAAAVLIFVAWFDVGREGQELLGLGPVLILLSFGAVMWLLLSKISGTKASARPINSVLWLHSIFEGALAALSFTFGLKTGLIVVTALLLHLLPESLAIIAALKQAGYSSRYAIKSYAISVGLLAASFGLLRILPEANERLLMGLSTIVAGGFIYLAISLSRKALQTS